MHRPHPWQVLTWASQPLLCGSCAFPTCLPAFKQSPPAIPALGTNVKKRRHGDEDMFYMHVSGLMAIRVGWADRPVCSHSHYPRSQAGDVQMSREMGEGGALTPED